MSPEGIAQIIAASATMIAAIGAFVSSWRNGTKLCVLKTQTDGMKSELVDAVSRASFADGAQEQRDNPPARQDRKPPTRRSDR